MKTTDIIYIAGHNGLVGSAIHNHLRYQGYEKIVGWTKEQYDLRNQDAVNHFFKVVRPDYVFLAAAKVGGILANSTYPAEFIYSNLQIQMNIIHAAYTYEVKKLLFLGSSCIYPKFAKQPIKEEYLLSGPLEETNEPYAVAKIAGIKMCQAYNKQYGTNFISVMPTNLYGPGDNYDENNSHVIPALIKKFYEAEKAGTEKVTIWGSGNPLRELLYVDDLAEACVLLMNKYDSSEIINIGSGEEYSIKDLAYYMKYITGYRGKIEFDLSKPDGTPRKRLDSSKLRRLGWAPKWDLHKGLTETYGRYRLKREMEITNENIN
jgi:GDP-L-fucose synthase